MTAYLHQDDFMEVYYDPELNCMTSKWYLPAHARDAEFKERMVIFANFMEAKQATLVYTDISTTHYLLVPEIQDWVNDLLSPIYKKIGLQKLAVLANKDFFLQVAMEQSINDDREAAYITRFFDNEIDAKKWLEEQ